MKIWWFIGFFCIINTTSSQTRKGVWGLIRIEGLFYEDIGFGGKKLFTGISEAKYYEPYNNVVMYEKDYVDGVLNGGIRGYYPSGNLFSVLHVKGGVAQGEFKSYYDNKQIKAEVLYVNGRKEGEYKEYYPSGHVKSISKYKDGEMVGVPKLYDDKK